MQRTYVHFRILVRATYGIIMLYSTSSLAGCFGMHTFDVTFCSISLGSTSDFPRVISVITTEPSLQVHLFHQRTNYYISYFPHTMSVWNFLDSECITSSTYTSFMSHLRS